MRLFRRFPNRGREGERGTRVGGTSGGQNPPAPSERAPHWLLLIFVFVIVCCGMVATAHEWYGMRREDLGQWGDAFGSLNAFFSGLAMLGVAYAVYLQRQEVHLQRQQTELAREELNATREELSRTEEARKASDQLLLSQTEALLFSARLNFARTVGETAPDGAHAVSVIRNEQYPAEQKVLAWQRARALSLDFEARANGSANEVERNMTMFQRYIHYQAVCISGTLRVVDDIPRVRDIVHSFMHDVFQVAAQEGIQGTRDSDLVDALYDAVAKYRAHPGLPLLKRPSSEGHAEIKPMVAKVDAQLLEELRALFDSLRWLIFHWK